MTRRALILISIILGGLILPLAAQQKKENPANAAVFDERAAAAVLGTIRNGLESHSQRRLLSAFDRDKMDGFLTFGELSASMRDVI
jgi:hypothetical protein